MMHDSDRPVTMQIIEHRHESTPIQQLMIEACGQQACEEPDSALLRISQQLGTGVGG